MTDIVIPLSKQSNTDNLELRIALRSIERYAQNVGNIWIYTEAELPWLRNANIVKMGDPVKDCKDTNLINKVLAAARNEDVAEHFMFWSDDQLLTGPLDLDNAPVVYNLRTKQHFNVPNHKWYTRMTHTLQYVQDNTGHELRHNYDAHTPQPYTKSKVIEVFDSVPYTVQPGFCINTIYYGMLGIPPSVEQTQIKHTFEKGNMNIPSKMLTYAGYDNASWLRGGAYFFLGMFLEPCRYEAPK